jgi:hypothetical protein
MDFKYKRQVIAMPNRQELVPDESKQINILIQMKSQ